MPDRSNKGGLFNMKLKKILSKLGPSFITTTTTFGPASLLLAGLAGALYRYEVAWVVLFLFVERFLFYDIGTRVGLSTSDNLYTSVGKRWGKVLGIVAGLLSFFAVAAYAAGNILGTSLATNLLVGGNIVVIGAILIAFDIALFLLKGVYEKLEKIALVAVVVMLVSFTATLFITGWSAGEFLRGLIPTANPGALMIGLAIFLTSGSEQGIRHTYMVRQKKYEVAEAKTTAAVDHIIGTVFMCVIIGVIMSVGAEVLNPAGVVPSSAPEFAGMLEPLAGKVAKILFGIGLFGAAFTSLTGQPIAVALNVADGFQRADQGTESPLVKKIAIGLIVVMGLWGVVPVALGVPMMNIYWICSFATFLAMPLNGVLMLLLSGDKSLMKELSYNKAQLAIRWVVFLLVIGLASYNFITSL